MLSARVMEQVLIIGASGGIGAALVAAHIARGDNVQSLSRSVDGFDLMDADNATAQLVALDGGYDRIIVATGALEIDDAQPEKTIKAIDATAMAAQFALNAIGPALVLAQAHHLLRKDAPACLAVLSARVGSIGDNRLGGWVSYRAAKAGLNQIVRTSAIELARSHPKASVIALHPGTVASAFTEKYLGRHPSVTPQHAADNLMSVLDGLTPDQTGSFLDYSGTAVAW